MTRQQWGIGIMALILAATMPTPPQADEPPEKWDPIRKFSIDLQRLGARFRPGTTQAQTDAIWPEIAKAVHKDFDSRRVEMTARLRNVTFRDGLATIVTTSELPPMKAGPAAPLSFFGGGKYEIQCSEADALAMKPGMRVEIRAVLTFRSPQSDAAERAKPAQRFWRIYHRTFRLAQVGEFVSSEYELEIEGKPLQGAWNENADPAAE